MYSPHIVSRGFRVFLRNQTDGLYVYIYTYIHIMCIYIYIYFLSPDWYFSKKFATVKEKIQFMVIKPQEKKEKNSWNTLRSFSIKVIQRFMVKEFTKIFWLILPKSLHIFFPQPLYWENLKYLYTKHRLYLDFEHIMNMVKH